jgi:hypothetical protein
VDTFVFSQPIGDDRIFSFDTAADKVDLIGYQGFAVFADVLAATTDDANGNAHLQLADGQSITFMGVHASDLTAANFVFDETPELTNAGTMTIGNGAMLPLSGIITNSGTIELASTGQHTELQLIQYGITLQGGGTVVLSDDPNNVIAGTLPIVTLTNVDNSISGAGQIGNGSLTLVNQGSITADGANALVIDTGANDIVNSGTLEATGAGGLTILGSISNSGLIWANGGNVSLLGAVTGDGDARISGTATLDFGAAASAHVSLDATAQGTVLLEHATDFSGSIAGFSSDDFIDLRDLGFGGATTVNYAEDADGLGGVLTIANDISSVHLTLTGDYDASEFAIASDGGAGTMLTVHNDDPLHLLGVG